MLILLIVNFNMKEKLELRDHRVSHGTIPSVTKWEAWPYHLRIVWTISPGNPVEWVEKTHELSEIQQQKGCKTRTWGYEPKLMVNFVFLQKIVFFGREIGKNISKLRQKAAGGWVVSISSLGCSLNLGHWGCGTHVSSKVDKPRMKLGYIGILL